MFSKLLGLDTVFIILLWKAARYKDYNYYNLFRIKKQHCSCFPLVFHFLPILNWLKKKIKPFSQSITKFPDFFMKLLSRALSTVVDPSVRGFRTTAFHSKPGLTFSVSIVSAPSLWKTEVSVFWSSRWHGFHFWPHQNNYFSHRRLTIMFVPGPGRVWGAEESRVVLSSEMCPLILPSEHQELLNWAKCYYVLPYWTGITLGKCSEKCSPVASQSSQRWCRLLISVENFNKS